MSVSVAGKRLQMSTYYESGFVTFTIPLVFVLAC